MVASYDIEEVAGKKACHLPRMSSCLNAFTIRIFHTGSYLVHPVLFCLGGKVVFSLPKLYWMSLGQEVVPPTKHRRHGTSSLCGNTYSSYWLNDHQKTKMFC
jgi:hypothetical protein